MKLHITICLAALLYLQIAGLPHQWFACPFYIALWSVPGFGATLWAMKGLAPTRLALAGGVGAAAYALYCNEMGAPFLAIWYPAGMLIPASIGALIGPYLLRW